MIDDLEKRVKFWSEPGRADFQGGNVFAKNLWLFSSGAHVLEIGPGGGRQFESLHKRTASYSVADISSKVLEKKIYDDAPKFYLKTYEEDLGRKFDVITFWYVMHHVKRSEVHAFFQFLYRHLRLFGHIYFNIPDAAHPDALADDGLGTTQHGLDVITQKLAGAGFEVVDTELLDFESLNILARKCL